MHCYDCLTENRTLVATAVCTRCGAGVCRAHVRSAAEPLPAPPEAPPSGERTARRLTCTVCHNAEHAGQPSGV